jgi:probable HAF family extracellular repeat protein
MQPIGSLHTPPWSWANGISGDGSTVVGASGDNTTSIIRRKAFRWTEADGIQDLGDLPTGAEDAEAKAANFDGSVIVGWSEGEDAIGNYAEAFRWTPTGGMEPLGLLFPDLEIFRESRANAVSDDGSVIVGTATDETGNYCAVRLGGRVGNPAAGQDT